MSNRFDIGDRVQWSEHGCVQLKRSSRLGTFKGWTRRGHFARVRWDGYKTDSSLHPDYIKHANGQSSGDQK